MLRQWQGQLGSGSSLPPKQGRVWVALVSEERDTVAALQLL